jgi:membrane-bound lytic murein transglycosylase D
MRNGLLPKAWPLALAASVLMGLSGCGASRPGNAMVPAVPPTPEPVPLEVAAAPPEIGPTMAAHTEPSILRELSRPLAGPSPLTAVLERARARFEAGRRLYRAGQMADARREFDRTLAILLDADRRSPAERAAVERLLGELAEAIYQYDISGLGGGAPDSEPVFEKSPLDEIPEPTFPIDPKLRNQVAEELKTTVSQLPLEITDEVLRYINYFSTERGRKILLAGLRNSGRYREMIQRIFDEEGIPQELIHLAQAESGFAPRAVSVKKAAGLWQFIGPRGREYGLYQTKITDDRLDPEKATRAAARHLKDLYNQFGDWYLAMAAYNCGPLNVEKAVARTGYADFWELRRRNVLPKETANYVPIILAMVIMAKNPGHYGLEGIEPAAPMMYSTIQLEADTSLELIGDIVERPVAELRAMNPALLTNVAPAGYFVHVPAGTSAAVQAALSTIPKEQRAVWRLHRVLEGESLAEIAGRYRTTADKIAALNPELDAGLAPGHLLIIPAAPPAKSVRPPARAVRRPAGTAAKRASAERAAPRASAAASAKTASPSPAGKIASKTTLSAAQRQPAGRAASATAAR